MSLDLNERPSMLEFQLSAVCYEKMLAPLLQYQKLKFEIESTKL